MTRYFLLGLFVVMIGEKAFGLDLSIGPGLSIKNALLYLNAAAIAIDASLARNRHLELQSVIVPFGLLFLYALLTWIFVVLLLHNVYYEPLPTFIRLKTKLADQLLMLLVFFYGVTSLKDALWLLKALVWVMMAGSLVTVLDTFNFPDLGIITTREDGRVEGIVGSAQEFGALLVFFLPLMIALWSTETGLRRRLALVGIGLSLVGVLLSASRGAVVGIVIGSIAAAIYLRRVISPKAVVQATVTVIAGSLLAVVLLLSSDFAYVLVSRMTHGMDAGDTDTLSSGRTVFWTNALRMMMQYPVTFITGFGWESYYQSIGHRHATHSVYVDRLYNLGLIGLALSIIPYVNSMAVARRALTHAAAGIAPYLMALVFGLAGLMVAIAFSDIETTIYAWGCTGVALRLAMASRAAEPATSQPTYRT